MELSSHCYGKMKRLISNAPENGQIIFPLFIIRKKKDQCRIQCISRKKNLHFFKGEDISLDHYCKDIPDDELDWLD